MHAGSSFIFGILSVAAALAQYIPYIIDTVRRRTKPHVFSWFVWGLPCGIVCAAQIMKGGAAGSWATGVTMLMCTAIFVLSFTHGEKNITRLDWAALLMALLAIALWAVTDTPSLAVILITVADLLGMVPTMRKSIAKPFEETLSTYAVGNVKWFFSLLAMNVFTPTTAIYPLAMFFGNGALVVLLIYRRRCLAPAS